MKALIDVDFEWTLNVALEYARKQIQMLTALKEKNVKTDDLIELVRNSSTTSEAEKKLIERYGLEKEIAEEVLDMPLTRPYALNIDYYKRTVNALEPLVKELHE